MSVADAPTVESRRLAGGRLKGDVCLVTGCSGGLGSAIAEAFALEGADVACAHPGNSEKDVKEAQKTVDAVKAAGGRSIRIPCDLTDEASVVAMVAACEKEFGKLNVLAAVAGLGKMAPFLETTTADFRKVHDLNVLGTYMTMREGGKLMTKTGTGGRMITISSVHGLGGTHYNAIYGSSKAAVIALTKGAAFDLADLGIRVNCIAPGAVPVPNDPVPTSKFTDPEQDDAPTDMTRAWMTYTPLKRWGEPHEIGRTAVFLACDDSSFMTGQVLQVDGGISAGVRLPSFRDFTSNHKGLPQDMKSTNRKRKEVNGD